MDDAGGLGGRRGDDVRGFLAGAVGGTWGFLTFVFLPLIQGGLLGVPLPTVVTSPALPMALAAAVYAGVLALLAGPAGRTTALPGGPAVRAGGQPAARDAMTRRDV